jgi:hypothetical protein
MYFGEITFEKYEFHPGQGSMLFINLHKRHISEFKTELSLTTILSTDILISFKMVGFFISFFARLLHLY